MTPLLLRALFLLLLPVLQSRVPLASRTSPPSILATLLSISLLPSFVPSTRFSVSPLLGPLFLTSPFLVLATLLSSPSPLLRLLYLSLNLPPPPSSPLSPAPLPPPPSSSLPLSSPPPVPPPTVNRYRLCLSPNSRQVFCRIREYEGLAEYFGLAE